MAQLFLTSSIHKVARDIASKLDLTKSNKLVFITTPVEPKEEQEDLEWLKNDRLALVDAGFDVSDYTITEKQKEQLRKDLSIYDYIYMSGGNTYYLLQQSQKTGFVDIVKELVYENGKTYISTSAGSIIAGKKCPDYLLKKDEVYELENQNGYGFVNFTILPHWGSDDFKEKYLGDRLKIAYQENQVPLLILTDSQYVYIKDDCIDIVEVNG